MIRYSIVHMQAPWFSARDYVRVVWDHRSNKPTEERQRLDENLQALCDRLNQTENGAEQR